MNNNKFAFGSAAAGLAALFALWVVAMPALAAEPVFPPGSRIGLVPPTGMATSNTFAGFTDQDKDAAIVLAALPAGAYSQIEKTLDADALKKEGVTLEKREPMQLGTGKGLLLTGRQVTDKTHYRKWLLVAVLGDLTALVNVQAPEESNVYSERVVRAALATLTMRPAVPEQEQLSLLPFTVGELAGFHVDEVVRGRVLVLSEPSQNGPGARMLIAALPGGPTETNEHGNFARLAFGEIAGIRDIHVTMSEPLRIGGQSGYQTMAEAKDALSGIDIKVVQWLRFGSGGFLQMVGIARAETWTSELARLRMVRDSIDPK
jgi:hypothetical protein